MPLYEFQCPDCGAVLSVNAPIHEGPGAPPRCRGGHGPMRRIFGAQIVPMPFAIRDGNRVTDADRRHQSADMARYEKSYSKPEADPQLAAIH